MKIVKIVFLVLCTVLFLAAVPWAIKYNLNYDRYGAIDRETQPVFIQIVTVNAGSFNNTLKSKAVKYVNGNSSVRIFVLALTAEQINGQEFDIRVIRDGDTIHAFISPNQTEAAIQHCKNFLQKLSQETDTFKISIK